MTPQEKLQQLGITLPPVATPAAAYVPFVRSGNLVFLSGHIARREGRPWVARLGHSATTSVRARDGQPTQITDANGLRTLMEYDAFGFATRKKFRGATDAVYLAPDQRSAVIDCFIASRSW